MYVQLMSNKTKLI